MCRKAERELQMNSKYAKHHKLLDEHYIPAFETLSEEESKNLSNDNLPTNVIIGKNDGLYYRTLSDEEIDALLLLIQCKNTQSIKSMLMFFVVLTVIGGAVGLFMLYRMLGLLGVVG